MGSIRISALRRFSCLENSSSRATGASPYMVILFLRFYIIILVHGLFFIDNLVDALVLISNGCLRLIHDVLNFYHLFFMLTRALI